MKRLASLFAALCFTAPALAGDLVLIRHGDSQHNVSSEYNSNPKHPDYKVSCLTPVGVEQAMKAATHLREAGYYNENIEAVFVSPLPRTRQTAKILVEAGLFTPDKIQLESRLIEVQAGNREATKTVEYIGDDWIRHDAKRYNGETNTQVRDRISDLYFETLDRYAASPKHVLYVTHGMPSYELIDLLTHQRIRLDTAGSYVLPLVLENA